MTATGYIVENRLQALEEGQLRILVQEVVEVRGRNVNNSIKPASQQS